MNSLLPSWIKFKDIITGVTNMSCPGTRAVVCTRNISNSRSFDGKLEPLMLHLDILVGWIRVWLESVYGYMKCA